MQAAPAGDRDLSVAGFNEAPAVVVRPRLEACLAVPGWVDAVLAGRPYRDREGLLARAVALAVDIDDAEYDAALARHPRIGERPTGGGTEAGWSRGEQSGVDPADAEVQAALRAGNAAYEDRFGDVFLIRAAGRSSAEILAALQDRLGNDRATERRVVREQLAEIAALRLTAVVRELESR